MFKRAGAFTPISLVIAMIALLAFSAGAVSAKPSASISLTWIDDCQYSVWYNWTGMGHGNDLTAFVHISGIEAGGSSTVASFSVPHKSGRSGILNHTFQISGLNYPYQFRAYGELSIPSQSQIIAKSVVSSPQLLPFGPVVCS
jgi:hypothetical protein